MKYSSVWRRTCLLSDIKKAMHEKDVTVMGFIRDIRDAGRLKFVLLADVSGTVQLTFKYGSELFDEVKSLTRESAIAVEGTVNANTEASSGVEIIPKKMKVFTKAEPQLPIQVYGQTDALLDTNRSHFLFN